MNAKLNVLIVVGIMWEIRNERH